MPTAKDLPLLNTAEDRCSCNHHWLSHSKHKWGTLTKKKNKGWCLICKKWCDLSKLPDIYKKLKP